MNTAVVAIPPKMQRLPLDKHHRPIPYFAADTEAGPDHRIADPEKVRDAHRFEWCWVCGQPRGSYLAFVIGPMCAVSRSTSEPPSHLECSRYSVQACPFLTKPSMRRRGSNLPEGWAPAPGQMNERNPGVTVLWVTRSYRTFRVPKAAGGGCLFEVGTPTRVEWWIRGRQATRAEAYAALDSAMPNLREKAETHDGPAGVALLEVSYQQAVRLLPPEPAAAAR